MFISVLCHVLDPVFVRIFDVPLIGGTGAVPSLIREGRGGLLSVNADVID